MDRVLQQFVLVSSKRIYNCFIDFTEAFDTVRPDFKS